MIFTTLEGRLWMNILKLEYFGFAMTPSVKQYLKELVCFQIVMEEFLWNQDILKALVFNDSLLTVSCKSNRLLVPRSWLEHIRIHDDGGRHISGP